MQVSKVSINGCELECHSEEEARALLRTFLPTGTILTVDGKNYVPYVAFREVKELTKTQVLA